MNSLFETIKKETDEAITHSIVGANMQWRIETLENLFNFCKITEEFTMNDFREYNLKHCKFETHDNRAMGGIMQTAKGSEWVAPTGRSIISRVGHKSPLQIWKSLLYKKQ